MPLSWRPGLPAAGLPGSFREVHRGFAAGLPSSFAVVCGSAVGVLVSSVVVCGSAVGVPAEVLRGLGAFGSVLRRSAVAFCVVLREAVPGVPRFFPVVVRGLAVGLPGGTAGW